MYVCFAHHFFLLYSFIHHFFLLLSLYILLSVTLHKYAPAPEPPVDDHTALNTYNPSLAALNNNIANKNKRMWETPSLANAAAIRKKRKQNFFEEEEATCAKCHYRRKCILYMSIIFFSIVPIFTILIIPISFLHILSCLILVRYEMYQLFCKIL